ncbi:response regulator [Paenibacillus sp. 1001270B_150601_E10]|uniref:response regulator n=1 Tax=Paenibacillus sp. 1001270B_150601_E10 TaxID=2787079 RepID=UPI0018A01233|nr:response regulator [Paenibacillus sp. 1001270B_150601_E10]
MKLRTKLVLGFASFMIIIVSLGVMSYTRMTEMQEDIREFYSDRFVKVKAASTIMNDAHNISAELVNELLNVETDRAQAVMEIQRYKRRIVQGIQLLQNMTVKVQEKEGIAQLEQSWTNYIQFVEKAASLGEANEIEKANQLRNDVGVTFQRKLLDDLRSLIHYYEILMDDQLQQSQASYENAINWTASIMLLGFVLSIAVTLWVIPSVTRNLNTMSMMIRSLAAGKLRVIRKMKVHTRDEIGDVIEVFKQMVEDLEERKQTEEVLRKQQDDQAWLDSRVAKIGEQLNGATNLHQVGQTFVNAFTPVMNAQYAALYIRDELHAPDTFELYGTYAAQHALEAVASFEVGVGLVGQCAADEHPIILSDGDQCTIKLRSGLSEINAAQIVLYPLKFENRVIGVMELASNRSFSELEHKLLEQLGVSLGIVINTVIGRLRIEGLLRDSQALTEELQCQSEELMSQQEELRRSNEHLESQTDALKRSEELLQRQQEELEHYNKQLVTKTKALEDTMKATQEKNEELEIARTALERQTLQLALTSKYKSEFLANMSHELRTPLNSLLVLSQLLAENPEGNLVEKQVEYARTIHMSGTDLLQMIDEILDLSKIDAGKLNINYEAVDIEELAMFMKDSFDQIAAQKNLTFNVKLGEHLPETIITDSYRLKQIVRNLLSNAFKFTDEGAVSLYIDVDEETSELAHTPFLAIRVSDTGIGIPEDKQKLIFEAFQQLDGKTSRKYGGAGLGLSISRELAGLLGGNLQVKSVSDEGSTFTLLIPMYTEEVEILKLQQMTKARDSSPIDELLSRLGEGQQQNGDHTDPVQKDDPAAFVAAVVKETTQSEKEAAASSMRAINGSETSESARSSDIKDKVKWIFCQKRLLIIGIEETDADTIMERLKDTSIGITAVSSGQEAIETLSREHVDGIVMDIGLSDMTGLDLVSRVKDIPEMSDIPIIVYTAMGQHAIVAELRQYAHRLISSDDSGLEVLLAEIMSMLKCTDTLPPEQFGLQERVKFVRDQNLSGKRILLVDDDVRNVFALSSVFEQYDMVIEYAENGLEAIELLNQDSAIDLVLMDMMMPEMDGYEAMGRIRQVPKFEKLPIIALTAKAMKEDRNKCIEAGASDYVSKPFQTDQLLSLMRVWLHQ